MDGSIIKYNFKRDLTDGLLTTELESEMNGKTENVSRWCADLNEKALKEALIKLGWTPPINHKETT